MTGCFPDQVAVYTEHNDTSHLRDLIAGMDLTGQVPTFDALHTVRANLDWLVTAKKAHYITIVKKNQPLLHARLKTLPWRHIPTTATNREPTRPPRDRTPKTAHVGDLNLPRARQAIEIT